MNVCTHSYSLVWYAWSDWEAFIDWMALSGINLFLAMTGQEEVAYQVFEKLGLEDLQIREWFNGPALLTWSRGQNEYGSNIAGPLPRSWMKGQYALQQKILNRTRSLGLSGQLPGFQGNVPIALKNLWNDTNMTDNNLGTAWMDALDPKYAPLADRWTAAVVDAFGTDHWWQLDGYFNGGTAPWLSRGGAREKDGVRAKAETGVRAKDAQPGDLDDWFRRGVAAYTGLNRTDPEALWSFQGWAFVDWSTEAQAASLKSFVDAAPPGKFVVVDMSVDGDGEWKMWANASFWGAPFVWTALHDFGGTDGMKGDLEHANAIPFEGPDNVWGTGFTPEGIDQNPVFYEFVAEANFRAAPVADVAQWAVDRAHKRYGLTADDARIERAWRLLVNSSYAQDLSVQDGTGVAHIGDNEAWAWDDRATPSSRLCEVYSAWSLLVDAAADVDMAEPFRYDLVNLGREVLAQVAGPAGQNFSDATPINKTLDEARVNATTAAYVEVLEDLDALVATDDAFLLGPWLEMAKAFAVEYGNDDCAADGYPTIVDCATFYEWNARVQLTTWNPTKPNASSVVKDGPIDYAAKHWAGLVGDYYAERVRRLGALAASKASAGSVVEAGEADEVQAALAYEWTTATDAYPTAPVGDAAAVSAATRGKYAAMFGGCSA